MKNTQLVTIHETVKEHRRVELFKVGDDYTSCKIDINVFPEGEVDSFARVFIMTEGSDVEEFTLVRELRTTGEDRYNFLKDISLGRKQSLWIETLMGGMNVFGSAMVHNSPYIYTSGQLSHVDIVPSNIDGNEKIEVYRAAYPLTSYCSVDVRLDATVGTGTYDNYDVEVYVSNRAEVQQDDLIMRTNLNIVRRSHMLGNITLGYGEYISVRHLPKEGEKYLPADIQRDVISVSVTGEVIGHIFRREMLEMNPDGENNNG